MSIFRPATPINDALTVISGSADATKLLRFEVDGFTTATTRVITPLDADMTLVGLTNTQTLTNKTYSAAIFTNGQTVTRTTSAAGNYTVLTTDYYIAKTGITGAGDTVALPAAATAGAGKVYHIKDEAGTAGTDNITIDPSGAELIDGAATKAINTNYGSVSIICSGTAWFVF